MVKVTINAKENGPLIVELDGVPAITDTELQIADDYNSKN